jgi:hypothetical protein
MLRTLCSLLAAMTAPFLLLFTAPARPFRVGPRADPWFRALAFHQGGGAALELLTGFVTAPSTTQTNLTMATGNSLTVRNAAVDSPVRLLTAWVDAQVRGILRIRSPKLHDNVQGLRFDTNANIVHPLLDPMFAQRLYPQDALTVDLSGSATAGDIETACLLLYYPDSQGATGRFMSPEDVRRRQVNILTVENSLATGTAGGYSGEEAINADFDLMKANTDYALIGYTVSPVAGQTDGGCAAVRWRGVDSGNLGVGGPGSDTFKWFTNQWFVWLSERTGLPLVPIFNSANRAGILIDAAQDENGLDVLVTSIFAELGPPVAGR